jgi:hypothetical protein
MGMADDRVASITALLVEAEQAHGVYETTELNGVYDQEWPRWYAAYAVEHGISAMAERDITTDALADFLASRYAEFEGTDPRPAEPWATSIARRIVAEL